MTYDSTDKILFSADAFGKFGALDSKEDWLSEARRYYFGIVGKYGAAVQNVLRKIKEMDIRMICPLHGPVLTEAIETYVKYYDTWSSYEPEEDGTLIAFTSVYGNTKEAVLYLAEFLKHYGCPRVFVMDLARCDMAEAVAQAFRYRKVVLATTTYNVGIFPFMREYIQWLTERNFSKRTVAFIENGSWMPVAAKLMKEMFAKSKELEFAETSVKIMSASKSENLLRLEELAKELCREYQSELDMN